MATDIYSGYGWGKTQVGICDCGDIVCVNVNEKVSQALMNF